MKLWAVVTAAVAALALAIWQAVSAWRLRKELGTERGRRVVAEIDSAQSEADAKTAKAREEAASKQRDALERLNGEVVHVDGDDLASALDRATGGDSNAK